MMMRRRRSMERRKSLSMKILSPKSVKRTMRRTARGEVRTIGFLGRVGHFVAVTFVSDAAFGFDAVSDAALDSDAAASAAVRWQSGFGHGARSAVGGLSCRARV